MRVRFGPRQQNQVFSRLLVILQTIPRGKKAFEEVLIPLLVLREWRLDRFEGISNGTAEPQAVVGELLGSMRPLTAADGHFFHFVAAVVVVVASERTFRNSYSFEMLSKLVAERFEELQVDRSLIDEFLGVAYGGSSIEITLRRIALAEAFVTDLG